MRFLFPILFSHLTFKERTLKVGEVIVALPPPLAIIGVSFHMK